MKKRILILDTQADGSWLEYLQSDDFDFTEYPFLKYLKQESRLIFMHIWMSADIYLEVPSEILDNLKRYDCMDFDCLIPVNDIGKELIKYFKEVLPTAECLSYSHKAFFRDEDNELICQYVFMQNSDSGVNNMNF